MPVKEKLRLISKWVGKHKKLQITDEPNSRLSTSKSIKQM
jgi:hypothetical protein